METKSEPATEPAKATTPPEAARTGVPTAAAMSMPRCPGPNGPAERRNGSTMRPNTGHAYVP